MSEQEAQPLEATAAQSAQATATVVDDREPELRDPLDPALYANREPSWLDFNDRVLQLAEDEQVPLIERLKFLAIFVDNLDEFFMIRVAGVHDQVDARIDAPGPDGLSPGQTLHGTARRVRELARRHAQQFSDVVRPELAQHANPEQRS